jgi:hypothetical protein
MSSRGRRPAAASGQTFRLDQSVGPDQRRLATGHLQADTHEITCLTKSRAFALPIQEATARTTFSRPSAMASGWLSGIAKASDSSTRTTIYKERRFAAFGRSAYRQIRPLPLSRACLGQSEPTRVHLAAPPRSFQILSRTESAEIKYRRGRE